MEYLNPKDLSKMFRAFYETESERHHQVALVMFFTGARISQVLALKGTDVFELDGRPVIKIGSAKRGQNGVRAVQFNADPAFDMKPLVEMAKRAGSSKLFGALDRHYFDKIVKRCGAKAGIHESYCHSHVFRHSAAIAVFDKTQRIGAVSQFLLHRAPSSAYAYLAENDGQMAQAAMDALQFV